MVGHRTMQRRPHWGKELQRMARILKVFQKVLRMVGHPLRKKPGSHRFLHTLRNDVCLRRGKTSSIRKRMRRRRCVCPRRLLTSVHQCVPNFFADTFLFRSVSSFNAMLVSGIQLSFNIFLSCSDVDLNCGSDRLATPSNKFCSSCNDPSNDVSEIYTDDNGHEVSDRPPPSVGVWNVDSSNTDANCIYILTIQCATFGKTGSKKMVGCRVQALNKERLCLPSTTTTVG
jgi:hypothetical protein